MKERLGDTAVILLRMHYLVTQIFNLKDEGFVLNVTNYPDIRDMLISDILITDYSSVFLI